MGELREDMSGLVEPALQMLGQALAPSGLVCHELVEGTPRGESVRYSLIVLLGLLEANSNGFEPALDLRDLRGAVDRALEQHDGGPGDIGLALWVESRADSGAAAGLVRRLSGSLDSQGGLGRLEGLELAWVIIGLALATEHGVSGTEGLLRSALRQLIDGNQAASGLFRHFGSGPRRGLPNFATEIYSVLALTAARDFDDRAVPSARRAADALLKLQLPDGGWPWLYHAERGCVVERYEIYSVHQHGMAPMALLRLSEAVGDPRYAEAARAGLGWLFGENELGAIMLDLDRETSVRSIRRRRPLDRLALYSNTAATLAVGRPLSRLGHVLELNRTCRPYELGWLVEAWAGAGER